MAGRHEPSSEDFYDATPEEFSDETPQENAKLVRWTAAPRPAIGFLCVMAIIGVASALAWRAYADRPWLAAQEAQAGTVKELKAAVQQLETSQQQLVQCINALQTSQRQVEHSRQADMQSISQQITSLTRDVEKTSKAAAKQAAQKRSSVADNKPKDSKLTQASTVDAQSASDPSASGKR